jgi:hypothetical protein
MSSLFKPMGSHNCEVHKIYFAIGVYVTGKDHFSVGFVRAQVIPKQ